MPGAGTPQIVLLVQRITEQLLRRWNNQGAVRAGQQGRGGKNRGPARVKTPGWRGLHQVVPFGAGSGRFNGNG